MQMTSVIKRENVVTAERSAVTLATSSWIIVDNPK